MIFINEKCNLERVTELQEVGDSCFPLDAGREAQLLRGSPAAPYPYFLPYMIIISADAINAAVVPQSSRMA